MLTRKDDRDEAIRPTNHEAILVATLGMFIIDTFLFQDEITGEDLGDNGLREQIGGGGTYFAVGARIWMAAEQILMTVDRGEDFPAYVQEDLDSFIPNRSRQEPERHYLWRFRQRPGQTTKAVNIYRGQSRGFEYLTPKIRLDPIDLLNGGPMSKLPRYIHCICSPERAKEIIAQVECMRNAWPSEGVRPIVVWEPIPDSAVAENMNAAIEAGCKVDVISPNHEEAANLLGWKSSEASMASIEDVARTLHERLKHIRHTSVPVLCIRSGAFGSFVVSPNGDTFWVKAFHQDARKIVDVTGAGNAWLGGFVAGLANSSRSGTTWSLDELRLAAQMGTVSAAYTIEQRGLPAITYDEHHSGQALERWNGDLPHERLKELRTGKM